MKKSQKVALVADWISDWWWAERVFAKLMEMYPEADIYTSVFWQQGNPLFEGRNVYTSFIQKIPILKKRHKMAMMLRPLAFESFDLSAYDLVISSSSAEAKGVITHPGTTHICYCHTPTRYLWSHTDEYERYLEFGILNPLAKLMMKIVFPRMRRWDKAASLRPDHYIANSQTVAGRIKTYYDRESTIIYPFFTPRSHSNTSGEWSYYFAIWRCIPYKKFDLLVDTFNTNGKKLTIATDTDTKLYQQLKKRSNDNITWIFWADNQEVADLFAWARGYLMPQEEDFGITPVEAMSHGCPVIAYGKWWATETVIDGQTGLLFDEQSQGSINKVIDRFESLTFDKKTCQRQAEVFSEKNFLQNIRSFIDSSLTS